MSDIALNREIRGLEGDKTLTKQAVYSKQQQMKELLQGEMGKDMKAVLNGEKTVEVSKTEKRKFKIKSWFKRLLRKF